MFEPSFSGALIAFLIPFPKWLNGTDVSSDRRSWFPLLQCSLEFRRKPVCHSNECKGKDAALLLLHQCSEIDFPDPSHTNHDGAKTRKNELYILLHGDEEVAQQAKVPTLGVINRWKKGTFNSRTQDTE